MDRNICSSRNVLANKSSLFPILSGNIFELVKSCHQNIISDDSTEINFSLSTTFCFSRRKAINLIPVPVLSHFLFYFFFYLTRRSKELRTHGEIVSRIIRHNLITQMFYGLNFIIVWGGGGGGTSTVFLVSEIVPVVTLDLHWRNNCILLCT